MKKHFFVSFLFIIFFLEISCQINILKEAENLYLNGEYGSAQNIFISQLNKSEKNDYVLFRIADCSGKLGKSDAEYWYLELLGNYKNSNYYEKSKFNLAKIYFSNKNYTNSAQLFSDISQNKFKSNEFYFKYGYSLFCLDDYNQAKYNFLKVTEGKYKSLSNYFYGYILYSQEMYNKSLLVFQTLSDDETFSKIIPYYITQIYFSLEKYSDIVEYAVPLLENVIDSREAEMYRIVSDSYYHLNDFKNAKKYFNKFLEINTDISVIDYFQIGQINIYLEDYHSAIKFLEKVNNVDDSISQYTSYYLGKSYLKVGQKNFAINAFLNASKIDFDLDLKEESLFNYFKLSYELDLPYSNLSYVMDQIESFRLVKYKQEVKRLLVNMFQITNQYQQAFDFLKHNHLPKLEQRETLQRLAFYIGVQHYNNANYSNALTKFEYSKKYPENKEIEAMCTYWLADCYYHLKDYDKSITYYKEYLETSSKSLVEKIGIAKYNLAYSYFQKKQYNKSIDFFRKSINSNLDEDRALDAKIRLADSYFMISNFSKAVKYYSLTSLDIEKTKKYHFDIDYCLYQQAKCYGLISDYKNQEKCLINFVDKSTESPYYGRAIIDLAKLYKNQNRNDLALDNFEKVLNFSEDKEVLSMSLLNKGLIYFNESKLENSIKCLKEVIEIYPNTRSFKSAKIGLKEVFLKKGSVDEYLEYISRVPQLDISVASKDSLSYEVALNNFKKGIYTTSKTQFKNYLTVYSESSIFYKEANFYYAESCWLTNDTLTAIESYEKVISQGISMFYEPSLTKISRYHFERNDYYLSNKYYQVLDSTANSHSLIRESIIRLMFGFEHSNNELANLYANRVIKTEKLNDRLLVKAKLIIARDDFDKGNFARASNICDEIINISKNNDASEAMYMRAYFSFLDEEYSATEELIFQLSEEYSSNHWIAKGFILLSDVYFKQGNNYQAKATLNSIIENHDEEDLINEAKQKLEIIMEQELLEISDDEREIVIQIGDSLDYEIIYSDLQIEEEF